MHSSIFKLFIHCTSNEIVFPSFCCKVEELFRQINDIFTYSLQSCQNIIIHDKRCFALYGYDILIDANFKP